MTRTSRKYTTLLLKELVEYKFDNRDKKDLTSVIEEILLNMEWEILYSPKPFCEKLGNLTNPE